MKAFGHNNIQHEVYIEGQNNASNNYNYNNLGNYNNNNLGNYNNNKYNNNLGNYNNNNLGNNNFNKNNLKNKPSNIVEEACIDKLVKEENKNIGFDLSLLKRDKLYVNLIHFDSNITKNNNYYFFVNLKLM